MLTSGSEASRPVLTPGSAGFSGTIIDAESANDAPSSGRGVGELGMSTTESTRF